MHHNGRVIVYIDGAADAEARTYVMAATVVPDEQIESIRRQLLGALLPGQQRFHWHQELREIRLRFLDVVGGFGLEHRVRISRPVTAWLEIPWGRPVISRGGNGRWDLARGACLLSLRSDPLIATTVDELVIASRGDSSDRKDRKNLADRREESGQVNISSTQTYRFSAPADDPLMWIPDAMAGAILAHEVRGRTDYVDRISAWRKRGLLRRRTGQLQIAKVSW